MRLILTGGGTQGHVTPNIAFLEDHPTKDVLYIGSHHGIERAVCLEHGIKFKGIATGKFRRYFSLQNFIDLFRVPIGIIEAFVILHKFKPDKIFSSGGYVSLPVIIAGALLRIPITIYESDSVPGLANKISAHFATEIWGNFAEASSHFKKFKHVALPIRKFLYKGDSSLILKKFAHAKKVLFIIGGSLGASALNDFVHINFDQLTSDFNVIHIVGPTNLASTMPANDSYLKIAYARLELADIYATSDIVLSRAGASTLRELEELKKPAILVPLPTTKSRGEQLSNAKSFAKHNTCEIIEEDNLNYESFKEAVESLSTTTH